MLRKLRSSDLERIMEIEVSAFEDPWPVEAFSSDIMEHGYGWEANGILIGYIFTLEVMDECSIINIAVDPAYHRQGIGETMMRKLIIDLHNEQQIRHYYLDVRASNIPAQRLYAKLGFKHLGLRRNYYRYPQEDAIVMGLIIPDGKNYHE